ncbi:uncharacterized protein METZ01_LOCUS354815, partial [marine metagenome]
MKQEQNQTLDPLMTRYVTFICSHPWKIVLTALILTLIALNYTTKLSIKSDFAELLPEGYRSVQDLKRLTARIGGIGDLTVVIETEDLKAGQKFADDLAVRLRDELPDNFIRFIQYKLDEERAYYENNQFLYAELEDLEEVYDRLRRQIQREKLEANPLFVSEAALGLDDGDEEEEPFDLTDIEEKYAGKASEKLEKWTDDYFVGNDEHGQFLVMRLKPYGTSSGVSFSEDLCNRVQTIIGGLNPT